ncbi:MAG: radical SAM protein [Elusimicrobia bacterium]|nr:radical SAM protein [Elusimicrobiota bacterium]
MKIWSRTFGCRVNQAESEELRARLAAAGCSPAHSLAEAELCVVNTCTVTRDADREALKFLRRASRENPRARLLVTGCLARRSPDEIRAAAPHAEIAADLEQLALPRASGLLPERARALLKVQDGCDGSCSYCVVPKVRPTLRSLALEEVVARVRGLVAAGVPEIVLCGIRLGRYSQGGVGLAGLLKRLLLIPGAFRLRLSSLEFQEADDALAVLMAESSCRLCPHLHLPLQSGCEATLRRMNRPYSAAAFARRVAALRRRVPTLALFTDIITGFPGETEAESGASLAFVRGLGLRGLHVFRYSAREGTPAASLPGQVPAAAARERLDQWLGLDRDLRQRHAREAVGQERVAVPLKTGREAVTEDFLTVRLDRNPGPGLWRVDVGGAEGGMAQALVLALAKD